MSRILQRQGVLPALHGLLGGVLLVAPGPLLRGVGGPSDRSTRVVARVLGARHLAQAVALRRHDRTAVGVGAATDVLHSASMLALASVSRPHRRVALASGIVAAALAAIELGSARRG
jgi:hypothetical protein